MGAETDYDRVGQVIAGKYRIVQKLGEGAFGVVWLSEHVEIKRKVVLKMLHAQWAQVPQVVERFRREAVASNRVNHPNICRVHDYAMTEDGIPYIAMEYLTGNTIKAELKRVGKMSIARVAEVMAPVCEAVAAAHQAGIIHRDLKLDNVMIAKRGDASVEEPIVLDFGIAKLKDAAEKLTQTGSMMGTPTYMSPEQCRGLSDIGPPSDVYSLAVMVYELLNGSPPFAARTVAELAMKHVLDTPPLIPNQPPVLAQVIASCLSKDPSVRPTGNVLAAALREAAQKSTGRQAVLMNARAVTPSLADTVVPASLGGPIRAGDVARAMAQAESDSNNAATMLSPNAGQALVAELEARKRQDALARQQQPKKFPVAQVVAVVVLLLGAVGAAIAFALRH